MAEQTKRHWTRGEGCDDTERPLTARQMRRNQRAETRENDSACLLTRCAPRLTLHAASSIRSLTCDAVDVHWSHKAASSKERVTLGCMNERLHGLGRWSERHPGVLSDGDGDVSGVLAHLRGQVDAAAGLVQVHQLLDAGPGDRKPRKMRRTTTQKTLQTVEETRIGNDVQRELVQLTNSQQQHEQVMQ